MKKIFVLIFFFFYIGYANAEIQISKSLYSLVEYIPLVEEFALMLKINPYEVSNPMVNQYYTEFVKGDFVNYEYSYTGYTYERNMEYYCFSGSQYCFDMTSKYYSFKKEDKFDLRININGYSPFYADYTLGGIIIMDDKSPEFISPTWNQEAVDYRPANTITMISH